jgi:hypothetical protein
MKYAPRTWGFSQARPKEPGIYFVLTDLDRTPQTDREREGWDVAHVYWNNSGWGITEPTERGHWRMKLLSGIDRAWGKGTWLKGPINPTVIIQRTAVTESDYQREK